MHSPGRRKTCEAQKGDSDVLDILMMIAAAAAAVGAFNIVNRGSVTLDDLAESSPDLAAALKECGRRFEEAVSMANYNEHHGDCWLTMYDGMMCESDFVGLGQEWRDLFAQAESSGWVPVVDRSEPEPSPARTAEECRKIAADAGWERCLGQGWTWEEAGGMVFGVNSPKRFCPKN